MTTKLMTLMCAICILAACGDSPPAQQANSSSRDMPQVQGAVDECPPSTSQLHVGHGTINRIDREAGRVNISHEPVESVQWPAMTMDFELSDPGAAANVKEGQKVAFHFTIESGGKAVVSRIEPQG